MGTKILGNHQVLFLITGNIRKTPYSFLIAASIWSYELKWNPSMIDAQTPPLSTRVPFVWIDPADSTIRGDKGQIKDTHIS